MDKKSKYAISVEKDLVPDVGLGRFVEGYVSNLDPFPYYWLFWLIIPFLGWLIGGILIVFWIIARVLTLLFGSKHRVYLYENGVLWVTQGRVFGKPEHTILRYDEIGGIKCPKTRRYQSIYGFKIYNGTNVYFEICGIDGKILLNKSFGYKNEDEVPDNYNGLGYATLAITAVWNKIALERLNAELKSEGYATFVTSNGKGNVPVLVGRRYIQVGENVARDSYRYSLDGGMLYIWPDYDENSKKNKYFTINVNGMYDRDVFLLAITQLLDMEL